MTRTEIRELTFELLYSLEIQKMEQEEYNEQIELFLVEQNVSQEKAKTYMTETINGIAKNKEEILELISQNLKEKWDISRVSKINITLLKLATYEIVYTELPYKVVVNEAVEKCFLSGVRELSKSVLEDIARQTISISKSCKKQIDNMKKAFQENNFKDATTGKITT